MKNLEIVSLYSSQSLQNAMVLIKISDEIEDIGIAMKYHLL
jgi:hypothetical protein